MSTRLKDKCKCGNLKWKQSKQCRECFTTTGRYRFHNLHKNTPIENKAMQVKKPTRKRKTRYRVKIKLLRDLGNGVMKKGEITFTSQANARDLCARGWAELV